RSPEMKFIQCLFHDRSVEVAKLEKIIRKLIFKHPNKGIQYPWPTAHLFCDLNGKPRFLQSSFVTRDCQQIRESKKRQYSLSLGVGHRGRPIDHIGKGNCPSDFAETCRFPYDCGLVWHMAPRLLTPYKVKRVVRKTRIPRISEDERDV